MFNGKRENKVQETSVLLLPEAPYFPIFHHFSRYCFSSHFLASWNLTLNSVLIQSSYSHECCMNGTVEGSNISKAVFVFTTYLALSPYPPHHLFQEWSLSSSIKHFKINPGSAMCLNVCILPVCTCMRTCICACPLVSSMHLWVSESWCEFELFMRPKCSCGRNAMQHVYNNLFTTCLCMFEISLA